MRKPPADTVTRNLYGPRSDRLHLLYPIVAGGGSELANLGRAKHPVDFRPGRIRCADSTGSSDPTPQQLAALWSGRCEPDGPYLAFEQPECSACFVELYRHKGKSVEAARGTLALRILLDATGDDELVIFSGGALRIARAGGERGGELVVELTDAAGGVHTLELPGIGTRFEPHTLVVTWGERGLRAWLDSFANSAEMPTAVTGWEIKRRESLRIGPGGATDAPSSGGLRRFGLSSVAWWDTQLTDREVRELLIDPHLPMRPMTSDAFLFKVNPVMTRATRRDDAADRCTLTFNCVTSYQKNATAAFRVRYRERDAGDEFTASAIARRSNADQYGRQLLPMPLVLENLRDNRTYEWFAEWSDDGETFFPFPGGAGRFQTPPAPGTPFSMVFITDDHRVNPAEGYISLDDPFGVESPNRKGYANWRANKDIYDFEDVDFLVDGGDNTYVGMGLSEGGVDDILDGRMDDLLERRFYRLSIWLAQHWLRLKTAPLCLVLGNHEGEIGYQQSVNNSKKLGPQQKQCTICRKRCIPGPDHETYAHQFGVEMGENEGRETDPAGNDWIPAVTDEDAAGTKFDEWLPGRNYRDDFVYDRLGPSGAYAENRSPLQNYFAWRWGDLLCVVMDVYRYANPGERKEHPDAEGTIAAHGNGVGGEHARHDRPWRFGPVQKQWLERVLAAARDVKWKLIFMHNLPGGEEINVSEGKAEGIYYGRGSGIRLPVSEHGDGADQEWLVDICQRYGVSAVMKGHDHKFTIVENGATFITGPTPGARSHSSGGGWNWTEMEESYGTSQSLGRLGPDGEPMPPRMVAMMNVMGYIRFDVSPDELKLTLRQTSVSVDGDLTTPAHYERWIGPVYRAENEFVDLAHPTESQDHGDVGEYKPRPAEPPRDVVAVYPVKALARPENDWWSPRARLKNRYGPPPGDEPLDEPYIDTKVPVAGLESGEVVVAAVPRDVFEYQLAAPKRVWIEPPTADKEQ